MLLVMVENRNGLWEQQQRRESERCWSQITLKYIVILNKPGGALIPMKRLADKETSCQNDPSEMREEETKTQDPCCYAHVRALGHLVLFAPVVHQLKQQGCRAGNAEQGMQGRGCRAGMQSKDAGHNLVSYWSATEGQWHSGSSRARMSGCKTAHHKCSINYWVAAAADAVHSPTALLAPSFIHAAISFSFFDSLFESSISLYTVVPH
jgi:hypothetical protein